MRCPLSLEFLIYWGLNVCLSVIKWNTMSADPRVSHLLKTKCVSVCTKWNTMSADPRVFSASDSQKKNTYYNIPIYTVYKNPIYISIYMVIITLNLSKICCIQFTKKKKQNSITILPMDISRVEWALPFFLNLPPSLIPKKVKSQ